LKYLRQRKPRYRFKLLRLSPENTYCPRCCDAPYVYFRADSYADAEFAGKRSWGVAKPYRAVTIGKEAGFLESTRFQIICAGRDGRFGGGSIVAADAVDYEGHADNFTNFSSQPLGNERLTARWKQAVAIRNLSPIVAVVCTLMYPFVLALRQREDGLFELARMMRRQWSSTECSATWKRTLEGQKKQRRVRVLRRMSDPSTEESVGGS